MNWMDAWMQRFLKWLIEAVPVYGRNDTNLHRNGEGGTNTTSVQRWSARQGRSPQPDGMGNVDCGSDEAAESLRGEQRTTVSGSIGKAGEGGAVAAGQLMRDGCGCRVMPVRDMHDRVQREGYQQPCEGNSQPLRPSSG
jgi:hypothetical protein